jgi:hypothetical protein
MTLWRWSNKKLVAHLHLQLAETWLLARVINGDRGYPDEELALPSYLILRLNLVRRGLSRVKQAVKHVWERVVDDGISFFGA